jgi:hypothetical protein
MERGVAAQGSRLIRFKFSFHGLDGVSPYPGRRSAPSLPKTVGSKVRASFSRLLLFRCTLGSIHLN